MSSPCATCKHAVMSTPADPNETPRLKCRRYPPTVLVNFHLGHGDIIQAFPDADETCGEYEIARGRNRQ